MSSLNTKKLLLLSIFLSFAGWLSGQNVAIKTNLLYDATSTLNLGGEFALSRKWTLDLSGSLNPWTFKNDKKFRLWMAQPEARYWFCEKFNGHFVGFHAMGGQYNVGNVKLPFGILSDLKDNRYEGWYAGGGFVYGYQWIASRHWNFEAVIGLGYDYFGYDKYKCGKCGTKESSGHSNYFGVTKLAVSAIYLF